MDFFWILINIIGIAVAGYIIKIGLDYNKGKEISKDITTTELTPAEINYLIKDVNYMNRAIVSTLLDLNRKGNISITQYYRPSNRKGDEDISEFEFKLLHKNGLVRHEEVFLKNIFGDDDTVNTHNLTKRAMSGKEFLQSQAKWVNAIESSLHDKGFYEMIDSNNSGRLKLIGAIMFLVGLISIVQGHLIGLVTILASMGSLLVGINMGMNKSEIGRAIHSHYENIEKSAVEDSFERQLSERELVDIIAMGTTMKYFMPIYSKQKKSSTLDPFTEHINRSGGSELDDAVLRGFMGFTQSTRNESIDTNRVDFRLMK